MSGYGTMGSKSEREELEVKAGFDWGYFGFFTCLFVI